MNTYHIQTFGCQMNYSDSERMETYLQALGLNPTEDKEQADIVVFNTCSIRQKAEDRVFGEMNKLSRLKSQKPEQLTVITGCMIRTSSSRYSSERDQLFSRMRNLDIALRIEEMPKLAELIREIQPDSSIQAIEEEALEDYFQISATHNSHDSKSQAFVAISNGCDKFCTYCIVPYSRGREKSRSMQSIIDECTKLVEEGTKEITLIGQTVNSYGLGKADIEKGTFAHLEKEPFVHLLEEIDQLSAKGLIRLRFTSPHPKDMSDQLIDAMANLKTLMPYLHLPVQSGDNRTLKRMNRTYTTERYREIIKRLREKIPDISVTTDVIVGFCGETEDEFQTTLKFYEEMGFEHAYIAQYSERRGTTADRFMKDDIPKNVKKERWHQLNNLLIAQSAKAMHRFKGKVVNVLVETQNGKTCTGRTEHFKTVQFESGRNLLGQIVPVKITNPRELMLEGELA